MSQETQEANAVTAKGLGLHGHMFAPHSQQGPITCCWEVKYGVSVGVLQTFLDDVVGGGLLNNSIKKIDTAAAGATPYPRQFTSAAADIKIIDLILEKETAEETYVAFEYFPPRTQKGVDNLYERFGKMAKQEPLYADVTWGAGGTTSDLTLEMCTKLQHQYGMVANMHLTCTNMEADKVDEALSGAKDVGIRNIVALRGDAPAGQEEWTATEGGFTCALDLVKHIRATHGDYFCVSVAGYPEGHPTVIKPVEDESKLTASELTRVVRNSDGVFVCFDEDYAKEIAYLKEKVDAGSDFILTQMFFDVNVFFTFCDDCKAAGINVPVIPGIMLIQNYGGFKRMTSLCKSRVPQEVFDAVEAAQDDKDKVKAFGAKFGTEVCEALVAKGHKGLHMYTLNLENVTYDVMDKLGLKKEVE